MLGVYPSQMIFTAFGPNLTASWSSQCPQERMPKLYVSLSSEVQPAIWSGSLAHQTLDFLFHRMPSLISAAVQLSHSPRNIGYRQSMPVIYAFRRFVTKAPKKAAALTKT